MIVRRLQPPPKKKKIEAKKSSKKTSKVKNQVESGDEENKEKKEEDFDDCNYFFPCNRWFSKDEDDGQIIRELVPFDATGKVQRKNSLPGK